MKPTILTLLLLIAVSDNSFSQQLNDKTPTLLWAIIDSKADTSYLFGTYHECGENYITKLYPIVQSKLRNIDCIAEESVYEKDMYGAGTNSASISQIVKAMFKRKKTWIKTIPRKDYKLINDYLYKRDEATLKDFAYVPPNEVIMGEVLPLMYTDKCQTKISYDERTIEEYLIVYARVFKKPLIGLEHYGDVYPTLKKIEEVDTSGNVNYVDTLIDMIRNQKKYMDRIDNCYEADNYRNLNINYSFSQPSTSVDSSLAYLCDARNDKWIPRIEQIIKDHRAFIAVGEKHLWYKDGLINQLVAAGYKVVPIDMKPHK